MAPLIITFIFFCRVSFQPPTFSKISTEILDNKSDQNKSQKSESMLQINVNREFFIVFVLSQSGDATAAGTNRKRSPQERTRD
jgi:hypothetical protein